MDGRCFLSSVLQVYICGDSAEAKQMVADLSTSMGLSVVDRGSLSASRELEDFPLQLFPQWRLPLCLATGLTAFFFFYLLIRDVVYAAVEQKKDISYRIILTLANKVQHQRHLKNNNRSSRIIIIIVNLFEN